MPHLISATLSEDAYKIYCIWKENRQASMKISQCMTQMHSMNELNEALITQLNIHKSRWRFLEMQMQYLMTEGGYNAAQILKFSQAEDSLYYRKE